MEVCHSEKSQMPWALAVLEVNNQTVLDLLWPVSDLHNESKLLVFTKMSKFANRVLAILKLYFLHKQTNKPHIWLIWRIAWSVIEQWYKLRIQQWPLYWWFVGECQGILVLKEGWYQLKVKVNVIKAQTGARDNQECV